MKSLKQKHMEDYEMDVPTKEQQEAKALNYLAEENASLKRSHTELLEAAKALPNIPHDFKGSFSDEDHSKDCRSCRLKQAISNAEKVQK